MLNIIKFSFFSKTGTEYLLIMKSYTNSTVHWSQTAGAELKYNRIRRSHGSLKALTTRVHCEKLYCVRYTHNSRSMRRTPERQSPLSCDKQLK